MIVTGGNQPELYDVGTDVAERRDIKAEYPAEAKKLEKELEAWVKTTSPAALMRKKSSTKSATSAGHSVNDE